MDFLEDVTKAAVLLFCAWFSGKSGLIVLAIPLAVAGIIMVVLISLVLIIRLKRKCRRKGLSRLTF